MRQVNALDERHLCLVRDESIDGRHVTRKAAFIPGTEEKKKKKKKKKKS
jgi:hypothetical protein